MFITSMLGEICLRIPPALQGSKSPFEKMILVSEEKSFSGFLPPYSSNVKLKDGVVLIIFLQVSIEG